MRDSVPLDILRAAEDRLLAQSIEIVEGVLDFAALGYDEHGQLSEDELPFEWGLLTPEQKARKIRLARYGCMSSKDIPHGAKIAHATAIGIIKARATENSGARVLNLEVSQFPAPAPLTKEPEALNADFEVVDID